MSRTTKSLLSSLAILAAASAPAQSDDAAAEVFLETAMRSAAPLSSCEASSDDAVGDVALRLWSRHRDVLHSEKLAPYVETSVRNAWRDQLRRRRLSTLFTDLQTDESVPGPDPVAAASHDADATAAVGEFRAALAPSDREVLGYLETGQTDREIASTMNRTRYWVRKSVDRIRQQARVHFPNQAPPAQG